MRVASLGLSLLERLCSSVAWLQDNNWLKEDMRFLAIYEHYHLKGQEEPAC